MSNAPEILKELGKVCVGGHIHQPLTGGRASNAAIYPDEHCMAICREYNEQRECPANEVTCSLTVTAGHTLGELPAHEEDNARGEWAW